MPIDIRYNTLCAEDIYQHFVNCGTVIDVVDIRQHSEKLCRHATTIEVWCGESLIGLCACYMNDDINNIAFISHIEVLNNYKNMGVGTLILQRTFKKAIDSGMKRIRLEVSKGNAVAFSFYIKNGFRIDGESIKSYHMEKQLI